MSEDYLWDRTGEPDEALEDLERTLAPLRFEALPLIDIPAGAEPEAARLRVETPARTVSARAGWPVALTAAVAVAAALLIWWWGFAVGQQRPPQVVVERVPVAGPPPIVVAPPVQRSDAHDLGEDPAAAAEPPPQDRGVRRSDARPRPRARPSSSSRTPSPPSSQPDGSNATSEGDAQRTDGGGDLDVDCILDPARCNVERGADPNLPEKLSTADLKAGISAVKPAAKACGPQHGASPGTKVKVKLSIAGATGTVTSAVAEGPHASTPLGACVAGALKRAKFPRFRKTSLGAVYPVSL